MKENRTIYAVQIDPAHQESPIMCDPEMYTCYGDDFAIIYNHRKTSAAPKIADILEVLEESEVWDALADVEEYEAATDQQEREENAGYYCSFYSTAAEVIRDLLPAARASAADYTPADIDGIIKALHTAENPRSAGEVREAYARVFTIVTGQKWEPGALRGPCQGDYTEIFYRPEVWSREALEKLETEFYNTGSEWEVYEDAPDGITDPAELTDGPEEYEHYSQYCYNYDPEEIKHEIADGAAANVVLFCFDGYTRRPKYTRA